MLAPFAGATAPTSWLMCDGSAVSRSTYSTLFATIGVSYGSGDGTTTFNVPDLRRRTPVGKGTSDSLGSSDGVAEVTRTLTHSHTIGHTHTTPNHRHTVPAHNHGLNGHTHTVDSHSHTVDYHTHSLSDSGYACIDFSSSETYIRRPGYPGSWVTTHNSNPDQGWASSTTNQPNGVALRGSTDGASPGTSSVGLGTNGPSTSLTGGSGADISTFLTAANEGEMTTNSQSTENSGSQTLPHLIVNYIIKT